MAGGRVPDGGDIEDEQRGGYQSSNGISCGWRPAGYCGCADRNNL